MTCLFFTRKRKPHIGRCSFLTLDTVVRFSFFPRDHFGLLREVLIFVSRPKGRVAMCSFFPSRTEGVAAWCAFSLRVRKVRIEMCSFLFSQFKGAHKKVLNFLSRPKGPRSEMLIFPSQSKGTRSELQGLISPPPTDLKKMPGRWALGWALENARWALWCALENG